MDYWSIKKVTIHRRCEFFSVMIYTKASGCTSRAKYDKCIRLHNFFCSHNTKDTTNLKKEISELTPSILNTALNAYSKNLEALGKYQAMIDYIKKTDASRGQALQDIFDAYVARTFSSSSSSGSLDTSFGTGGIVTPSTSSSSSSGSEMALTSMEKMPKGISKKASA